MQIPDFRPEHFGPLEAVHYTRFLDAVLKENSATAEVASRPDQLSAVEDLLRRRYGWRGYAVPEGGKLVQPPSLHCVTLLAEGRPGLLGTLTVRPDSPEGLLAERTYPECIENLRLEGHRVGELTKLAVEFGADWKAALDALVRSAYVITRMVHALTDVVIEVNPRHVGVYRRIFGFVTLGAERVCARVGAPSVLMRLDLEAFGRRLPAALARAA